MAHVSTSIEIASTPSHVRAVFLDFAKIPEWSPGPFTSVEPVSPSGSIEKGEKLRICFGSRLMTFTAIIMENSPNKFVWRNRLPYVLTGEHTFRFEPSKTNPGGTTFINSEEFGGGLGLMAKAISGDKNSSPQFEKFNEKFKDRVEGLK